MKRIIVALTLALGMAAAQAREAILVEPGRVTVHAAAGQEQKPETVRTALAIAGAVHGWVIAQEAPGKLTLKYNKMGKHEIVVDAAYDATGFEIKYVNSTNMNFRKDPAGATMIHPNYNSWVNELIRTTGIVAAGGR
jgi:hypothetical protein